MQQKSILYAAKANFFSELKDEVRAHIYIYESRAKTTKFIKHLVGYLMPGIIYACFLVSADGLASAMVYGALFSVSFIFLTFNVFHDAHHIGGKIKPRQRIDMLSSSALIGISGTVWRHKHNVLHHNYTNIVGVDADVDTYQLMRLSKHHKWWGWHKYQIFYAPLLYSLLSIYVIFYADFKNFIDLSKRGKMSKYDAVEFVGCKLFYFSYFIMVPIASHNVNYSLGVIFLAHMLFGLIASTIVQLAHINDISKTKLVDKQSMSEDWATHQLQTTTNFATNSLVITHAFGGLNFQIEHHLFPNISHAHYFEISKIVKRKCKEIGMPYNEKNTLFEAIYCHCKALKQLGEKSTGQGFKVERAVSARGS
jgi:linoleoyl-CoA desaturase